jgi:hypothetical protein
MARRNEIQNGIHEEKPSMDFGGPSLQPNDRRVLMDLQEENTPQKVFDKFNELTTMRLHHP